MSTLTAELIEVARRISEELAPPPVSGALLPTEDPGPDRDGSFCAVQLGDGATGVAYVLLGDTRLRLRAIDPASLVGRDAATLAEGFASEDPGARALGLAAINALSRFLLDRAGHRPDFAANSIGSLQLSPGSRLGMVGFFPPLVKRAREAGAPLTVLELKADLVQESPELTVTLDPSRLAECRDIVCTSTALLNGSLEALLGHCRGCRELVLIGPSAGVVPDPLFARGVTGVGGAWVTDPATFMARVSRGERWGDAARKYSLRNDAAWPGLEALLRRARR